MLFYPPEPSVCRVKCLMIYRDELFKQWHCVDLDRLWFELSTLGTKRSHYFTAHKCRTCLTEYPWKVIIYCLFIYNTYKPLVYGGSNDSPTHYLRLILVINRANNLSFTSHLNQYWTFHEDMTSILMVIKSDLQINCSHYPVLPYNLLGLIPSRPYDLILNIRGVTPIRSGWPVARGPRG